MQQPDLNQQSTDSPDGSLARGSPEPNPRKRKGPSTSSRGVASLTPDQLEKKRANDREAQRAIRERTKRTIESLEAKIRGLEAQQPYQELQTVLRQKNAIQQENEMIRSRLASIMSLIQPILGAQGLTGGTYHSSDRTELTLQDLASAAHHNAQTGMAQSTFPTDGYMNGRGYGPQDGQIQQGQASQYPQFAGEGQNTDRTWEAARGGLENQDNIQRNLDVNSPDNRMNYNALLDSLGQRIASASNQPQSQHHSPDSRTGYPSINYQESSPTLPQAPWTVLPKNTEATCPLDNILLNFITTQRREIAEGGTGSMSNSLNAPTYPSVASLLNPTGNHRVDRLSQLMTEVIDKFPNIANLPERVATLFFMFSLTRWMISPTQENYDRIPEFFTPRPSQLMALHPAWIDHIPFPRMRDKLVATYKDIPFDHFFMPFTIGMSVNWPYDPQDCLIATSEKEDPIINPVFERHIRRLENWSVSPVLMETFPGLADTARVRAQATGERKLD